MAMAMAMVLDDSHFVFHGLHSRYSQKANNLQRCELITPGDFLISNCLMSFIRTIN